MDQYIKSKLKMNLNSADRIYIHNEEIEKLDKSILDLDYYRKLVDKNKFTDRRVVSWELFEQNT